MADRNLSTLLGGGGNFIPNAAIVSDSFSTTSTSFVEAFNANEECVAYEILLMIPGTNPVVSAEMRITRDGTVLATVSGTGGTGGTTRIPFLGGADISGLIQTDGMSCLSSLQVEIRVVSGTGTVQCEYVYQTGTTE